MDKPKGHLTNEYLTKVYSDNFSLALTAIELAKTQILSGKDTKLGDVFETLAKAHHGK